jgi:hypothetical protein
VQGENSSWEITQFTQADLTGNVDVNVEASTAWPKSQMMRRASLKEAMEAGVFAVMQNDPELGAKLLEFYDLTEFKPSFDVDRKQIMRELDRWKAATMPEEIVPPNPTVQFLPLHLQHKKTFLKTEECEALASANAPVYGAMLAHVQQIEQILAQQQAAAMAAQQPPPPPGPPGKGQGGALDDAVKSGALQPKGEDPGPGAGGSLEQAIQSGALQPQDPATVGQPPAAPPPAGPSIDELTASGVLIPEPQQL